MTIEQRRIPVTGSRAATGPLTFGQRNTLAWVDNELDRFSAVLGWRFELPDGVSTDGIAGALASLVARHEALRTLYPDGAGQQRVLEEVRLPLELHELAGADDADGGAESDETDDEVAERLLARLRERGVDFTDSAVSADSTDEPAMPPMRAALATRAGTPAVLVALYSHMAVDFASTAVLGRELTELLTGSELEPVEHQPVDQAAVEEGRQGQRQAAGAVRYWGSQLRMAPASVCSLPPPEPPGQGHWTGLLCSTAGARALAAIATRAGSSRQSVVLAALCAVLSLRTGLDRCAFVAVSSNRFRLRLRGYVGTIAQDGLIGLALDAASFDELVARAGRATLAANSNSLFDHDRLWEVLDGVGADRGIAFSRDFTLNDVSSHLGGEPGAEEAVPEVASTLEWTPAPPFPTVLMCNPFQLGPVLQLALTVDTARLARTEAEDLLWATERLLVAAAGSDLPLDRIGEVTGLSPFERDGGWWLVDGCWLRAGDCQRLLAEATGAAALVLMQDGRLTGYLDGRGPIGTAELAHAACMQALRDSDRRLAMAPHEYVLYDGRPGDPEDEAAWRALPVLAAGTGRVPWPELSP